MKTNFEKKLEWYSNKSYLAKRTGSRPRNIDYAIKRWPNLKPELKDKYFSTMIEIGLIKEGEYTRDTLFDYEEVWEKEMELQK